MGKLNYYTPKVDEFCIGFEYERRSIGNKKAWSDVVVGIQSDLRLMELDILNKLVRVKRIDPDDIEDLGFSLTGYSKDIGNDVVLTFEGFNKKGIEYTLVINTKDQIILKDSYGDVKFSGRLKNKSELRNQLKRCRMKLVKK